MEILKEKNTDFICKIIGPRITEDDVEYYDELKRYISNKKLQNNIA
jgi:hypothetical protein